MRYLLLRLNDSHHLELPGTIPDIIFAIVLVLRQRRNQWKDFQLWRVSVRNSNNSQNARIFNQRWLGSELSVSEHEVQRSCAGPLKCKVTWIFINNLFHARKTQPSCNDFPSAANISLTVLTLSSIWATLSIRVPIRTSVEILGHPIAWIASWLFPIVSITTVIPHIPRTAYLDPMAPLFC